jgi:hypothetical protein
VESFPSTAWEAGVTGGLIPHSPRCPVPKKSALLKFRKSRADAAIVGRAYRLVLVRTLIAKKENMANTVATPERATEWIATYIKEKKHTLGKRSLAKQYREEFFIEYSAGEMTPEKKALITSILGSNFFLPVDRFDSECQQGATYLAWKAQDEG